LPRQGLTVAAIAALLAAAPPGAAAPPDVGSRAPKLVLLLAVDQLRSDRIGPDLPGGLGRLEREGRVFADAALEHSDTETCPGHVTMLTGHHPGPAGVPSNDYIDRATGESVYCVEDPADDARLVAGSEKPKDGRSPRNIRVDTLGDWLKAAQPGARVFAVSGKDRAAIALGGQRPDGVYWYERASAFGFTTSHYYRADLPEWARPWHAGGDPAAPTAPAFLGRVPERWEHPTGSPANGARTDDYPAESAQYLRVSGHPVRDGDVKASIERLYYTPFLDDVTLDFARTLVRAEKLGRGPAIDLLAVSLSANDLVGHLYGPRSQEARDALRRLDVAVGKFLTFLEAEVGKGRVLVVLTADHGVLDLPEWLVETGASECPLPTGRGSTKALGEGLAGAVHEALDPPGSEPARWILSSGYAQTVNRKLVEERHVPVSRVVEAASAWLSSQPGVVRVWTAEEMAAGQGPAPFAALYHNSFDPERSGDFSVQTAPTCLFSPYPAGTSHGTPYPYDRAVPVVFFGPGVAPGVVRGRAATVDIAPTLAARLGIPAPAGLDGRILPLAP
jgi:predicted AlkP superfamily pyrophosphatase or phosphodiesterase